jgi:hypothetical protein
MGLEDLGVTDFELIDRKVMIVAGAAVGRWQRPWETVRPAVEDGSGRRRAPEHRMRFGAPPDRHRRETPLSSAFN